MPNLRSVLPYDLTPFSGLVQVLILVWVLLITLGFFLLYQKRTEQNERNAAESESLSEVPILSMDGADADIDAAQLRTVSDLFKQKFGTKQSIDFIVVGPGRVNLIGEHIDYCGYGVMPMACARAIAFAVGVSDKDSIVQLVNSNKQFTPRQFDLSNTDDYEINRDKIDERHWSLYWLAAFNGCKNQLEKNGKKVDWKGMRIAVNANLPTGSGLSSSSAFLCGSSIGILHANRDENTRLYPMDIAKFCIACERLVGVDSGGMDQTIIMNSRKGTAKYVTFVPSLQTIDVRLPSSEECRWVVSNCLRPHRLQDEKGTKNYNTRVVECRLAAKMLAKALGIEIWNSTDMATLRDVQSRFNGSLSDMVFRSLDILDSNGYTIDEIEDELDCKCDELMHGLSRGSVVVSNLRSIDYRLQLQQRAVHVYSEANRVLEFKEICDNRPSDMIGKLGELMNGSHKSCRDLYDCSCEELDLLTKVCIDGGALGSRLTGAGWGGSVISLIPISKLKSFEKYVKAHYYSTLPKVPLDAMFHTTPAMCACILQN